MGDWTVPLAAAAVIPTVNGVPAVQGMVYVSAALALPTALPDSATMEGPPPDMEKVTATPLALARTLIEASTVIVPLVFGTYPAAEKLVEAPLGVAEALVEG